MSSDEKTAGGTGEEVSASTDESHRYTPGPQGTLYDLRITTEDLSPLDAARADGTPRAQTGLSRSRARFGFRSAPGAIFC